MQRNYLVAYDISDPMRLRQTYMVVRNFGVRLQYSVYHCVLSASQRAQLSAKLQAVIHSGEDQVLFIDMGAAKAGVGLPIEEVLGRGVEDSWVTVVF